MTVAEGLTRALVRASIPIVGVSIGTPEDRTTWSINYDPIATDEQRAAGDAITASYDLASDTVLGDEEAAADLDRDKRLRAIVIWAAQRFNVAPATARSQIIAIYRTLT